MCCPLAQGLATRPGFDVGSPIRASYRVLPYIMNVEFEVGLLTCISCRALPCLPLALHVAVPNWAFLRDLRRDDDVSVSSKIDSHTRLLTLQSVYQSLISRSVFDGGSLLPQGDTLAGSVRTAGFRRGKRQPASLSILAVYTIIMGRASTKLSELGGIQEGPVSCVTVNSFHGLIAPTCPASPQVRIDDR